MEITFEKLQEKRNLIIRTYGQVDDVKSKKVYAMKKWDKIVIKLLNDIQKKYAELFQEGKSDIEIDNALEFEITKDGKTLHQLVKTDKGELTFSKEGEKAKIKAINKLVKDLDEEMLNEVIEFEPYLVDEDLLNEAPEDVIEELKGIFIK